MKFAKHITITLFILFLSVLMVTWAQDYNYRLEGSFSTDLNQNNKPVSFDLSWSEGSEGLTGTYQDTYFTQNGTVTGTAGDEGRIFNITFPDAQGNVKSMTMVTTDADATSGEVPLSLTIRNRAGATVAVSNTSALLNRAAATGSLREAQEATGGCDLGALSGFCGIYQGSVIETFDSSNRCLLNGAGTIALELSRAGLLRLFTNYINTTVNLPAHPLGSVQEAENRSITKTSRNCGALAGTNFFEANCQRLNFIGSFSGTEEEREFNGTYTITDEVTGDKCSYSLEMVREITY
jgi:hypothetical protein